MSSVEFYPSGEGENYGISSDIIASYRRSIQFNNQLLIEHFDRKYDFNTTQEIEKRRRAGSGYSELSISKYINYRVVNKATAKQKYITRLERAAENSVKQYVNGVRTFIGLSEF